MVTTTTFIGIAGAGIAGAGVVDAEIVAVGIAGTGDAALTSSDTLANRKASAVVVRFTVFIRALFATDWQ